MGPLSASGSTEASAVPGSSPSSSPSSTESVRISSPLNDTPVPETQFRFLNPTTATFFSSIYEKMKSAVGVPGHPLDKILDLTNTVTQTKDSESWVETVHEKGSFGNGRAWTERTIYEVRQDSRAHVIAKELQFEFNDEETKPYANQFWRFLDAKLIEKEMNEAGGDRTQRRPARSQLKINRVWI